MSGNLYGYVGGDYSLASSWVVLVPDTSPNGIYVHAYDAVTPATPPGDADKVVFGGFAYYIDTTDFPIFYSPSTNVPTNGFVPGDGSAYDLEFNSNNWTIAGRLTADYLDTGYTLTVTGALNVNDGLTAGTLEIFNGATITAAELKVKYLDLSGATLSATSLNVGAFDITGGTLAIVGPLEVYQQIYFYADGEIVTSASSSISNGAQVSAGSMTIAYDSIGLSETFSVIGKGTKLSIADLLQLDSAGATISVAGTGAAVDTGQLEVLNGTVSVSDESVLSVANRLTGSGLAISAMGQTSSGTGQIVAANLAIDQLGTLAGAGTIDANIINGNAILAADSGVLELDGNIDGDGTITIGNDATLIVAGTVAASQNIAFAATVGVLDVYDLGDFSGLIGNFVMGDTIDLVGQPIDDFTTDFSGEVFLNNSDRLVGTLTFAAVGGYALVVSELYASSDGSGGTDLTLVPGGLLSSFPGMGSASGPGTTGTGTTGGGTTGGGTTGTGTLSATASEWIAGSGTWSVGTNWSPSGPPGASHEALVIVDTGGTIAGPGIANDAAFGGAGAWTYTGGTLSLSNAATMSLGPYALAVVGNLTVTSATIDTRNGGSTGAPVAVENALGALAELQVAAGGSLYAGTANSAAQAAILVGRVGDGTLDVNGGFVSVAGGVVVGFAGAGQLTVESNGTLRVAADPANESYLDIGFGNPAGGSDDSGGSGRALIETGGHLSSANGVFIGGRGDDGSMTIESGGVVTAQLITGSGDAALLVGGTIVVGGTTYAGTGSLDIEAGGTFDASAITPQTAAYDTAIAPTGTAAVTVDGAGALLDAGLNGINIGLSAAADGTLMIDNGGTLLTGSSNSAAIAGLAAGRAGNASITVSGTAAALESAGEIYVGRAGSATLDVLDTASLDMSDASSAGRLQIGVGGGAAGFYTGGNGTMTVAGGGTVESAGAVQIGGDGVAGTLVVNAGLLQTTANVLVGLTGTAAANEAVITAAGTTTATAATQYAGTGSVTVANGGTLAAPGGTIAIGVGSGSTGTLVVSGGNAVVAAADLAVGATAAFGTAGAGVISLLAGGTIAVSNAVEIGAGGTLLLAGGVLDPPVVTADPGSTVSGFGTIQGAFVDDTDDFNSNGGVLDITGLITGSGTLVVPQSGTLTLGGAVSNTEAIAFAGPGGVLQIADLADEKAPILGWKQNDTIDLTGIADIGATGSYNINTNNLSIHSGATTYMLPFDGSFTAADFMLQPDAAGGLEVVNPCFAEGTRLRTTRGEVAVQALRPGDTVPVLLGSGPARIIWIGHRQVDCRRQPAPHRVWPVRIAAHAFGTGMPARDLFLSPDHAIFHDGVLIPVKYLLNAGSVDQVQTDHIRYFHVELLHHDVLLAEGLAVESYLDTGDRGSFDNGGAAARPPPDFAACRREALACAPLMVVGPHVHSARRRLASVSRRAQSATPRPAPAAGASVRPALPSPARADSRPRPPPNAA